MREVYLICFRNFGHAETTSFHKLCISPFICLLLTYIPQPFIRLSCCFSQQEFADKAGVSIVTIKRIESCKVNDIALSTLLKILRISGTLEGVVGLVPELPDSPFLINEKTGKRIQRINSKRKMA